MARGKHAAAATAQVRARAAERTAALERQVRVLQHELAGLRAEAARVPRLEQRCQDLQHAIANGEQPEVARLLEEAETLRDRARDAEAATETMRNQWGALLRRLLDQHGGGQAGMEAVAQLTGLDGAVVLERTATTARMSKDVQLRLAQARRNKTRRGI